MQTSCTNHPALIIAFLLAIFTTGVSAQEQSPGWKPGEKIGVGSETYQQVLDILFPRDALDEAGRYVILLRYLPSFDPESQFTLVEKDGTVEVLEYTSADGNINQKLHEIYQRTKREDAFEMAKQIRVRQRILKTSPAEVKSLRSSLYDVGCALINHERKQTREDEITGDGMRYQIWSRGKGRIHYHIDGLDIDDTPATNEHPLIGWMKTARRTLSKSAAPQHHNK